MASLTCGYGSEGPKRKNCIFCGAGFYKEDTEAVAFAQTWKSWKLDCSLSLCSLFSLSGDSFQKEFADGPYCTNCSSMVWDIHFTMKQIRALERRLQNLKMRVENKIRRFGQQEHRESAQVNVSAVKLIATALENDSCPSQTDKTRRDLSPPLQFPAADKLLIKLEVGESCNSRWFTEHHEDENILTFGDSARESEPTHRRRGSSRKNTFSVVSPVNESLADTRTQMSTSKRRVRPKIIPKFPSPVHQSGESESATDSEWDEIPATSSKRGRPKKGTSKSKPKTTLASRMVSRSPPSRPAKKQKGPRSRQCRLCSTVCQSKKERELHMKQEHPDHQPECIACHSRLKNEELLETHMIQMHGGVFPIYCSICQMGFQTEVEVAEHKTIHASTNPFTCSVCQTIFTNSFDLQRHVPTHLHKFKCTNPGCDKTFATKTAQTHHEGLHKKYFVCDTCGKSFQHSNILASHMSAHSDKTFPCNQCSRSYKSEHNLKEHMAIQHNPDGFGPRRFPYKICGKAFTKNNHRKRHEEIHSGTASYLCNICGKQSGTQAGIESHKRNFHNPDPVAREKRLLYQKNWWKTYKRPSQRAKAAAAAAASTSTVSGIPGPTPTPVVGINSPPRPEASVTGDGLCNPFPDHSGPGANTHS